MFRSFPTLLWAGSFVPFWLILFHYCNSVGSVPSGVIYPRCASTIINAPDLSPHEVDEIRAVTRRIDEGSEDRREQRKKERDALSQGLIPDGFIERHRIVDPSSEVSREFQVQMETIARKLLPHHDFENRPIRFLLADEEEMNAFTVTIASPPLIVFTKGTIQKAKHVDELAYILGHEWTHNRIFEELGPGKNSKGEEYIADIAPLVLLHDAGFDPKAGRIVTEWFVGLYLPEYLKDFVGAYDDVHGDPVNRKRAVEKGLAFLQNERGDVEKRKLSPMNPSFYLLAKKASHVGYLARRLQEANYYGFSSIEKHRMLVRLIPELFDEPDARFRELGKELSQIQFNTKDSSEVEAFDELVNAILDIPVTGQGRLSESELQDLSKKLYSKCARHRYELATGKTLKGFEHPDRSPLGRFGSLAKIMKTFIDSATPEEAKAHAVSFLGMLEQAGNVVHFRSDIDLPNFALPSVLDIDSVLEHNKRILKKRKRAERDNLDSSHLKLKRIPLPWNRFLQWAESDSSHQIRNALVRLGISDQRLMNMLRPADMPNVLQGNLRPITLGPHSAGATGLYLESLVIDERGNIRGFQKAAAEKQIEQNREHYFIETIFHHMDVLFSAAANGNSEARVELLTLVAKVDPKKLTSLIGAADASRDFSLFCQVNSVVLSDHDYYDPTRLSAEKVSQGISDKRLKLFMNDMERSYEGGLLGEGFLKFQARRKLEYNSKAKQLVTILEGMLRTAAGKEIIKTFFMGDESHFGLSYFIRTAGAAIPFDTPIVDFVIEDRFHIFSVEEKAKILAISDILGSASENKYLQMALTQGLKFYDGEDMPTRRKKEIDLLRNALNLAKPKNEADLIAILKKLHKSGSRVTARLATLELQSFLHERKRTKKPIDLATIVGLLNGDAVEWNSALQSELQRQVASQKKWPSTLKERIQLWQSFDSGKVFPDDQILKFKLLGEILAEIEKQPCSKQIQFALTLIKGPKIQKPDFRDRIENIWATSILEKEGIDTGNAKFEKRVMDHVIAVKPSLNFQERLSLFAKLANVLQTQEKLSQQIKESLVDKDRSKLEKTQAFGSLSERALGDLRVDKKKRTSLLVFLTNPITEESLRMIVKDLDNRLLNYHLLDPRPISDFFLEDYDGSGKVVLRKPLSQAALTTNARLLYENFWSSPFLARAAMLEELLCPPQSTKDQLKTNPFKEALNFVTDRLFPSDLRYAKESKQILEAYIKVIPDYQRGLFLSALMVAVEKSSHLTQDEFGAGKRLAMVLELLGPAEVKLGQAIHSYPKTPEDIRREMKRLKQKADEPPRWELFSQINSVLPIEIRSTIKRINALLGSASYYIVVEVTLNDGEIVVLAILRPYAEERALRGFDILSKFTKELGKDTPVVDSLTQLIEQAQRMSKIETSPEATKIQSDIAERLYRNREVTADGLTFEFEPVRLLQFGPGYRLMSRATGVHFNDLRETTEAEIKFKKALAKAYLALEMDLLLRGAEFDHDRHGAQMKIDGTKVTLFDFGAMSLNPPSPEDRKYLANMIFDCVLNARDQESFSEAVVEYIKNRSGGESPEYLVAAQKGLLAMGDYLKYIEPSDLKQIVASVVKAGHIHPDISGVIQLRLFGDPGLMMRILGFGQGGAGIEIK